MDEKDLEKLKEFVFRDIRSSVAFRIELEKTENAEDYDNPIEMIRTYQNWKKKNKQIPDAERWSYALDSYERYECFSDRNCYELDRENHILYCKPNCSNKPYIKITADLLTGPKEIIDCADRLDSMKQNDDLQTALKMFCSVAYTVGNCCPAMFNPFPYVVGGADTCWMKLQRFIEPEKEYQPIYEHGWNDNLVLRGKGKETKDNMFCMFPEELSGKEIIDRLLLMDYSAYPDLSTPQKCAEKGVEAYIEYLNIITILIIKRGIRIYFQNKRIWNKKLEEYTNELFEAVAEKYKINAD